MTDENQRLHAIVSGHVQGVNFRYYTMVTANDLNLTGWVRNLNDGNVEVTAEGPRSALERLARFLYTGPSSARVEDVDIDWSAATGQFAGFHIR